ncbi:MAG: hypothetical protein BA869_05770 [Desulfuromonadales bacterium C00003107]|jgi:pectate lyase|nr:MAG: hypothetical protein BA869_05770 [Desulfuromonadales bacterium C00003107]
MKYLSKKNLIILAIETFLAMLVCSTGFSEEIRHYSSTKSGTNNHPYNDFVKIASAKVPTIHLLRPKRRISVFPGARGFGTETEAGRGGIIIRVTNLNDNGAGSLREAVENREARIIVFEVGGTVELKSNIKIRDPYCTIAGQTAPPPGITIKHYGIKIASHDILIQHLRIRPGDKGKTRDGSWDNLDALQLNSGAQNIVIDHVSASWAVDENISTWAGKMDNATFSNCIISEGLHNSVHTEQPHSKGLLIGPNSGNISILGNLMAHNIDRVPQIQGGNNVIAVNNLIYEGGEYEFVDFTDPYLAGPVNAYFESNLFIDGPSTSAKHIFRLDPNLHPESKFFQQNNRHFNRLNHQAPVLTKDKTPAGIQVDLPPVPLLGIAILDVETIEAHVLSTAGARPAERGTPVADPVDERIIQQVRTRTGKQIDCVEGCANSAPGGWPIPTKSRREFTIPINPNGDRDGDGYTNIEEVLHQMATEVE